MSRTVRPRWWRTVVVLGVMGGGASLGGTPAAAAPSDVVVAAPLQPAGTPLDVTGGGCTAEVTVRLVARLAGAPEVLEQATVTPAADGSWSATMTTPSRAAAVESSCDGVDGIRCRWARPTARSPAASARRRRRPQRS